MNSSRLRSLLYELSVDLEDFAIFSPSTCSTKICMPISTLCSSIAMIICKLL